MNFAPLAFLISLASSSILPSSAGGQLPPTGDGYTLDGYSPVMADLAAYDIDYSKVDKSRMLMMSFNADEARLYLYVYRANISYNFDTADISTVSTYGENNEITDVFKSYRLSMVSLSADSHYVKFLVRDLIFDELETRHRFAVRQIYSSRFSDVIAATVPVALEYLVSKDSNDEWQTQVNSVDSVVIDDKKLYLTNFVSGEAANYHYWQDYYLAFNFKNFSVDDLLEVKIKYDYFDYTCLSKLTSTKIDVGWAAKNFDGFQDCDDDIKRWPKKSDNIATVKPEHREVHNSFLGFFKHVYSWDTISKVSDMERPSSSLNKYTWLVHFVEHEFYIGFYLAPRVTYGFGLYEETLPPVVGRYHNSSYSSRYFHDLRAREVTDATVFEITYQKNGEIKKALVVDSYTNSSGNMPIYRELNFFEHIVEAWKGIFKCNFSFHNVAYAFISVLIVGLVLWLLSLILRLFKRGK